MAEDMEEQDDEYTVNGLRQALAKSEAMLAAAERTHRELSRLFKDEREFRRCMMKRLYEVEAELDRYT